MKFRPSVTTATDRRLLIDRLLEVPVGEVLTYEAITDLLGRDVRTTSACRSALHSALNHLRRHRSAIYAAVPKVGYKRLDDCGKVTAAESTMRRAHRAAHRSAAILAAVEKFDAMPEDSRTRHNALMSIAGAIALGTSKKSLDKVQERVREVGRVLPLQRTLDAFAS